MPQTKKKEKCKLPKDLLNKCLKKNIKVESCDYLKKTMKLCMNRKKNVYFMGV